MYVYNNTVRLINPGAKLPLLPGENKLTPAQAAYLQKFDLSAYLTGKNPWLTISESRIVEEETNTSQEQAATAALKAYVEDNDNIADATDGVPEEESSSGGSDLAAQIAARIK